MWGNLAGKLADKVNVRETMARIGDVVAPPLSDDEYETDDDDEEYEYYEEEGEYEEKEKPTAGSATESLGALGALLQQAVDDEEETHHRLEVEHDKEKYGYTRPTIPLEDDDEDVVESNESVKQTESSEIAVSPETKNRTVSPPPAVDSSHYPGSPVPHRHDNHSHDVPLADETIKKSVPNDSVQQPTKTADVLEKEQTQESNVSTTQMAPPDSKQVKKESPKLQPEAAVKKEEFPMDYSVRNKESQTAVPDSTTTTTRPAALVPNHSIPETTRKASPTTTVPEVPSVPQPAKLTPTVPEQEKPPGPNSKPKRAHTPLSLPLPPPPKEQPVAKSAAQPPPKEKPVIKSEAQPPPMEKPVASAKASEETLLPAKKTSPVVPKETAPIPPAKKVSPAASKPEVMAPIPPPPPPLHSTSPAGDKQVPPSASEQQLQRRCQELEKQLQHAETHIVELQSDAARRMDEEEEWRQSHLRNFQQEQARIVEAATEAVQVEHEREMAELRELLQQECLQLKRQLEEEQTTSLQQSTQFQRMLEEAEARALAAENEARQVVSKQEASTSQVQQRQERAVRMAEDKLAHTMAKLDERDEEIKELKEVIRELKATSTEHHQVAQEAEEEMDELHTENETLQMNLHAVEAERDELKKQLKFLNSQKEKMDGLQMELKMLKEARDRERAHRQTAAVNAESSQAELVAERDAALSTARDLEQQLMAALADLEVARSDTERVMTAHSNLQNALESIQSEREAEMGLVEEQRLAAEEATAAAHAAAIEATHEANEARMREVQMAADSAVKRVMGEVQELQEKLEDSRKENVNLRRSLDEAIHRLQATQEDVIDRVFMKNTLLDWFSKNGKGKKEVLEVMASLLHFTEEEKDAIHIGGGSGTFGKVVGAVAAPLPPSAADMNHLEGDSVREKWVSFLLAETGGEDEADTKPAPSESINGEAR